MITQILVAIAIALGLINPAPSFVTLDTSLIAQTEADQDELEWEEFYADSYQDHASQFDAMFNALETKWAKNGRLMIRSGNSGSFKFAKKG